MWGKVIGSVPILEGLWRMWELDVNYGVRIVETIMFPAGINKITLSTGVINVTTAYLHLIVIGGAATWLVNLVVKIRGKESREHMLPIPLFRFQKFQAPLFRF
jgi:hypothetical protein